MAVRSYPVFIPYKTGGSSSTPRRSARDICENDYNKTEDPALSECMNEVMVKRQHSDSVNGGLTIGLCSFMGLAVIGFIIWMIWDSRQ